jgi:uncharacterized protein YaeQ
MNGKFSFNLASDDGRRPLPGKIIIGQAETQTIVHVALKLIGYLLFYRERLQIETRLPNEMISYVPDLAQLDYELRPVLWIECGECSIAKLHKLAVKANEAELWVIKKSHAAAEETLRAMQREGLRRDRYNIIGLDEEMFDELCALIRSRNDLYWYRGTFDPPQMQFDLNQTWFDMPFLVLRH